MVVDSEASIICKRELVQNLSIQLACFVASGAFVAVTALQPHTDCCRREAFSNRQLNAARKPSHWQRCGSCEWRKRASNVPCVVPAQPAQALEYGRAV
jgi:hypothetical protein